ncbi:MAG: sigma-70 family RNA polymerase sigma factor [Vicinamibacterales bacterium]
MTVGLDDAALAERVAEGDRDAEAEFCRRMAPRIRLYGLRHLRSAAAADDLVQHVLVSVLGALRAARLRDHDKLAAFVLGTCRMTVREQRRTERRQDTLLSTFGSSLVPAAPAPPRLDDARLARCVQGLSERERSVIVMAFYDERSAADTAARLGTSEANVRVIRHRAIRQLRACMEGA